MSVILSVCFECKHLNQKASIFACTAFPEGIPIDNLKSDRENVEICNMNIHFEEIVNE